MATGSTIHRPSRVDRAHERLKNALRRLEEALPPPDRLSDQAESDLSDKYRAELATFGRQVQTLEAKNTRLQENNRQISERLNQAVDRFKRAIGD